MVGKFFFLALWALYGISQASSLALTKEFNIAQESVQSSQQAFKSAVEALGKADVRTGLVNLIRETPEEIVTNLADLLNRNSNPEVAEILDAFNAGFGQKLLIINEENVQIDADAFERLLSQNAKALARTLYPNDYFQQLITFSVLQRRIKEVSGIVRSVVGDKKVPVETFVALLSHVPENALASRAVSEVQQKDLVSDIVGTVEVAICQLVVQNLYNQVSASLDGIILFLNSITIAAGDNFILNLYAAAIQFLVDLASEGVSAIESLLFSISQTICGDLFGSTSRKRRDLTEVEFQRDTSLVRADDIFSGLFDIVWSLISTVLNGVITGWVNSYIGSLQVEIDNFIQNVVIVYIDNLIDSIFPALI